MHDEFKQKMSDDMGVDEVRCVDNAEQFFRPTALPVVPVHATCACLIQARTPCRREAGRSTRQRQSSARCGYRLPAEPPARTPRARTMLVCATRLDVKDQ